MDFTQAQDYSTDVPTGHRYHDDAKATPTVWSGKDANSLIWSLMEVVAAAGLTPKQFDRADATTYKVLKSALDALYAPLSSTGGAVGDLKYSTGTAAPPDCLAPSGATLTRAAYPALWAFAQSSGNLVTDAFWTAGAFGAYSSGNGATTFRTPDLRGYFLRALNIYVSGPDPLRGIGTVQSDAFQGHEHQLPDLTNAGGGGYGGAGSVGDTRNTNTIIQKSGYSAPRYADETRPINIALPLWLKYR
jgi:hypothetical protein